MSLLINAEWYKLIKSRVLLVALILSGALLALMIQGEYATGKTVYGSESLVFIGGNTAFWQMALIAVIGFFCAADFASGTIRNPVGLGKRRSGIYASRLFSAITITAVTVLLLSLLSVIICTAVFGFGEMGLGGFAKEFILTVLKQTLCHAAFAAVFLMFAFVTRSQAASILCGFFYMIFMQFLPWILAVIGGGRLVWLSAYIPNTHIAAVGTPQENTLLAVSVCFAYIVLSSAIGGFVFSKQDVK